MTPVARALGIGSVLLLLLVTSPADAQEASRGERPTANTAEDLGGAMQGAFDEPEPEPSAFPLLTGWMQSLPPFFRDTSIDFKFRTFYWRQVNTDESIAEAWAIGGLLNYQSGWLKDIFRVGAAVYTSQPLYAPKDRDGTGLLREGQKGYTIAGEAYADFQFKEGHILRAYRQLVDLPYVNAADVRMTPNSFEAYLVRGQLDNVRWLGQVNYVAGWIDKIRNRDKKEFISMSEAAGVPGGDNGMAALTLRIRPTENFYIGLTDQYVANTYNTVYGETSWVHNLTSEWQLRLDGQFTWQKSVALSLSPDYPFDTWMYALRLASSWKGAILTLAGSNTDKDARIRKDFGLSPSYLGLMQSDFDRAGERAWLVGLSYDFGRIGLKGLSGFTNFAMGFDGRVINGGDAFATQRELNVTLDYRLKDGVLKKGWLKGLWLRGRFSRLVLEGGERPANQVRLIVNYDLSIL